MRKKITVTALLLIVNLVFPYISDDLTRQSLIHDQGLLTSVSWNWLNHDPRFGNIVSYLILSIPSVFFRAVILTILQVFVLEQFKSKWAYIAFFVMCLPAIITDGFFWLTGFCNYGLSIGIFLWFYRTNNPILAFISGMTNYILFPAIALLAYEKRKTTLLFFIGWCVIAFASGTQSRMDKFYPDFNPLALENFFDAIWNVLKFMILTSPIWVVIFIDHKRVKWEFVVLPILICLFLGFIPSDIYMVRNTLIPAGLLLFSVIHTAEDPFWKMVLNFAAIPALAFYLICTVIFSNRVKRLNVGKKDPVEVLYNRTFQFGIEKKLDYHNSHAKYQK